MIQSLCDTDFSTYLLSWGMLAMHLSLLFKDLNEEKTNEFGNAYETLLFLTLVLGSATDIFCDLDQIA